MDSSLGALAPLTTLGRITVALLLAGAVFFVVMTLMSIARRKSAPRTAQIQALLAEEERRAARATMPEQLRYWAGTRGYTGTLGPIALGLAAGYLIVSLVLATIGMPPVFSLIVAAPLTWAITWIIGGAAAARRKQAFDRQLLDGLVLLAGQLEAGVGLQRGLRQVQATTDEPFRSALGGALQQAETSRDLVGPLTALSRKYPSRAFDLFIAALEVDRDIGGRIEPAIKEAAGIMQRDFALVQEATAEISQARSELWGILILLVLIAFGIIGAADEATRRLYVSPGGLLILGITFAWAGFGVLRSLNIMRTASGLAPAKLRRSKESR